jgi:hypothetical protein
VNAIQEEPVQSNEEQALLVAENSGLELGVVDIPEWREVIELLNDDDENVINDFIQDNVAIKIKKMQDYDTRKVVEDKAKTKEPEQPSEQSSGAIRISSRERVQTKRNEDYELYVTVAEEEEFLLATNGDDPNDEDDGGISNEGNHAEMDDKALSAVAHHLMVHCTEKEMLKKRKRKYKPKAGQYTLDTELKKCGSRGETAGTKELRQFNTYEVFEPLEASTLDEEEKKGALSLLIFLKEKQNGDVKAQSCANGSVQRNYIAKEEAASPTVGPESVFATAAIDAEENREVVTIDISWAFLHTTNKDYVVMWMNGRLAKLMVKTDPKLYQKYLTAEKGKKVLYLRLQKALYGIMKSALLFYRKLISELNEMGFEVNPYNPCVVNKIVNGSQIKIQWHVDDLMISHSSGKTISKFLCALKDIYGDNLAESTGKIHDYLGMTFNFSLQDEALINMTQ